jgi:KaiC/GvpD/RAD55 family RecA-like ATPase
MERHGTRKILIMGLPGAGKTTLALCWRRFSTQSCSTPTPCAPICHAISASATTIASSTRRMGWMCDRVVEAGGTVIADCADRARRPTRAAGQIRGYSLLFSLFSLPRCRCGW